MASAVVRKDPNPVIGTWDIPNLPYNDLWVLCQKFRDEAMKVAELQGEVKSLKQSLAEERHKSAQLAAELNRRVAVENAKATVEMKLRAAEELMKLDRRKTQNVRVKNELD